MITTFFPGFQSFWSRVQAFMCFAMSSLQNLAPFDILRFSHHFFHFAADFVTLSRTKIAIFPTL